MATVKETAKEKKNEKAKRPIDEFLSEASEFHALFFGFYSAWFTLRIEKLSDELKEDIKLEYHYYAAGFMLGRVIQGLLVLVGVNVAI